MAIDYATLVASKATAGSIAYWANHSGVDSAGILVRAQAWIYERIRAREMRASTTVSLSANGYTAPLPTQSDPPTANFLQPVEFKWRGCSEPMDYVHESLLGRYIAAGDTAPPLGQPQRFAIYGELFQFEVSADTGYVGDLIYYRRLPDLDGTTNKTNFITVRFPLLLQRICTALAFEDRKRDATQQYQMAEQSIAEANVAEDLGRQGMVLR